LKNKSIRGRGPKNLLHGSVEDTKLSTNKQHTLFRLDTVAVKEVTKEGRDVSGLGSREVLVVRDVLHVHALQVRILWRTETKKQCVDLIWGVPILISLGGQASRLENLPWLGRAGRDRVHTCPSRHRHQEERSVLQFFFVAPHAACRSLAQRSHHPQLAGAGRRELTSVCVRESQYMRGRGSPWYVSSFCMRVAVGGLGRGNHASAGSDILL